MPRTARERIFIGVLLAAFVAGGIYLYMPLRLGALALTGRAPHCPLLQAVRSYHHYLGLNQSTDWLRSTSRLIRIDERGFELWDTPRARFWVPPNERESLLLNLAEQENKIYGVGAQAVERGDVVLDCGASVGVYTREALDSGARLVVAVEPFPDNIECLRRSFEREVSEGRVIVYPKGVWDRDDLLAIQVDPSTRSSNSFVHRLEDWREGAKLPLTTIDKLAAELKLPRVDYIKMDIEGAEQRALAGAAATIRKFHPSLALSAYHRPDDPERIPAIVRDLWPGYKMECGPCAYVNGRIRPDVFYFH